MTRWRMPLRYLGGISGSGTLCCDGRDLARASYAFDGYLESSRTILASGEVRAPAGALNRIVGRRDVKLRTDDGRVMTIKLSEQSLAEACDAAHVDVTAGMPETLKGWRH